MSKRTDMTCGNCGHYQRDGHCTRYLQGSPTKASMVATQQLYCDWTPKYRHRQTLLEEWLGG